MSNHYTVTKLRQDPDGIWRANVSVDGVTLSVQCRGGWQTLPDPKTGKSNHLLPDAAAYLQSKMPLQERKAKR